MVTWVSARHPGQPAGLARLDDRHKALDWQRREARPAKEAAANVKEGAKDATAATGRALERTGEKMQNASK